MVLTQVSVRSHQYGTKQHYEVEPPTLPGRRRSAFTADASETSPCRQTGSLKRHTRSPKGVTATRRPDAEGIETLVRQGQLQVHRIGMEMGGQIAVQEGLAGVVEDVGEHTPGM